VSLYTGRPICVRCGGPLRHDGDWCPCGGRSQYAVERSQAHISQEQALELISREESRSGGLGWYAAFQQLMERYVSPGT
jgi:hypothetical protein